ncbi:cytochrome P450 87A3-like [Papaver somniferum]|nr:cytochrome P450 87A3-like [Papaver somniferum]
MLVSSAVHMCPKSFPDPQTFDPWRWNNIGDTNAPSRNYIPFGGGLRHCVGAEFSKAVMAIFLRVLVTKFSWKKIKGGNAYRNPALSFGRSGFHVKISEKGQIKN